MWGVLGKLFGSGQVIEKGMDLIDSIHTSTEEEIRAKTDAKVRLLESYSGFKVAQRYLAVMFGGTFIISFFLALGFTLRENPDADSIMKVVSEFQIGWITLTIIGFYFGGGAFEGIMAKRASSKGE